MMLSPTLKLTMDEQTLDRCVIDDESIPARWIIGLQYVPDAIRVMSDVVAARGPGISSGKVVIPIDAFVLLASGLGYYRGLHRRDDDTDIRTVLTVLAPGLTVEMDELAGDHCAVTDLGTDIRWVIGIEEIPDVLRLLDSELRARSAGIQTGERGGVRIPIDAFVLLAAALGYYLGLTWREADTGIKRPSLPEFAHLAGIPLLARLSADGRSSG